MLLWVFLLLGTRIVDGASQCRKNWKQYGIACYYINTNSLTWENAQAYCETQGGNLASIADSGVNGHVAWVMSGYSKAHIGLTDTESDGTWSWWDGSSMTYTNWNSGEPNGNFETNCGGMHSSGTWDDYPCTNSMVSVCRAPIQYTATKTGCACPFDSTRTDCACCVTGGTHCGQQYPNECYYSSFSECGTGANDPIDDWQLVMKVTRSSNINVYDLYTGSSTYNDGSTTANILTSTSVSYKSSEANTYNTNSLQQIKFAFYSGGVEMRSLTFETSGTSRTNWFHTNYMSYAPYSDIYTDTKNYQSMAGTGHRRFFINRHYGGCSGDAGWVVISDYGSSSGCTWDNYYSKPFFIYSAASTYQTWESGSRGFPDTVAFLHKYYDDGTDDQAICDSGWTRNRNGCYKLVESTSKFRESMKACRALHDDADLASVADQEENDFLLTLSRRTLAHNNYWIGLTDMNEEGTWEWSDGSVVSYTNWKSGEPSGGSEHCAALSWSSDGIWNDATCWTSYGYFCKYPLNKVSCADWKRKGYTSSGYYTIDPDGRNIGVDPFRVYCDMTTDASTGITKMSHQEEYRSLITGYEGAYSASRVIRYQDRSIAQVAMVADISASCDQFIKYECHGSLMTGYGAWYDRNGNQKNYWGGASVDSGQCACGNSGTCTNGHHCNCNTNDNTWREDSGYLTDKTTLPVTEIRFGDTGDGSESGYYTLGPLYCKGDESYIVTDRTDFMLIRERHISNYNNDYQTGLTVNQCAAACVAASSFVCRSFDYHPSDGGCYLSEENDLTVALTSGSDYHLHVRIMDPMVDPYEESNSCSSGWLQRGSYCYRPYHSFHTWLDAETNCQNQGGHIATPTDLDEYKYLRRIFRWAQRGVATFWVGLNDIEEEGTWKDAEGNDPVYTNWKSGEPNGGISENGVVMHIHSTNEYIDTTVQGGRQYVCKEDIGAGAIPQPTTHPLCDSSSWAWDDHSCYFFGTNTKSWSDAQDYCQELGGDLVTVETEREFNFLVSYYRYRYSSRRFWIGLRYIPAEDVYRWETAISEYPWDGSHWDSGKPDGAASDQTCVEFSTAQSYNDEVCSASLYYICEKDTLPTSKPSTFNLEIKGPTSLFLSWSALPQAEQNSDVNGYYIHYWPRNKQHTNNVTIDVSGLSTLSYYLTGIASGTNFEFILQAYTEQGGGPETDPPINGTTDIASVRSSERRKANFILVKGNRLKNHALYELEVYTLSECTNVCLKDEHCVSVNYHKLSRAPKKSCVLNRETHTNYPDDLVPDRDYMYGSIDGL
ncbi:uncharacterized protein LOC121424795 [Lytechinus variegatus]|uniref:uncharacterized protein LOC121424795 n=1 Tax=Lytechinus variegatus TaxID=7654 RepID=UPI001BB297F9|nr:uncharacterized protein LOC121424795 [Lytechinus variegatus]